MPEPTPTPANVMKDAEKFPMIFNVVAVVAMFWVQSKHGWESPWTLWAGMGVLLTVTGGRFWTIRTRLDKLEKSDRKPDQH